MNESRNSNDDVSLKIINIGKEGNLNEDKIKNGTQLKKYHQTFESLKKNSTNLFNQNAYTDDQFKLQDPKFSSRNNRKIVVSRLKDFVLPGTPLFGDQISTNFNLISKQIPHYPKFICQLFMLPFWHYQTLIQPKFVNQKGFYHVVLLKDGRMIKQVIDDTFYYDQTFKTIYHQFPEIPNYIWIHILLKAWAKCKGSFSNILHASPFQFIKTFSFPDWKIINPALQDTQKLISQLNPIQKKQVIAIAKTKDDKNVGLFGLIPNSASYIISGHEMQFQAIFIKLKTYNGTKWNKLKSLQNIMQPQQEIKVQHNQFVMPIRQFNNLFHLIYITPNKFNFRKNIYYNRYSLNLDARQSKAKMISFQVINPNPIQQKQGKQSSYMVDLTFYFPSVRAYDLNKQRIQNQVQQFTIPRCKLMFGKQSQTTNLQASFVQSMKQKMLQNQDGDFLYGKSSIQYEWIQGTYFKGYDNSCVFPMRLKPGKYFLRFKIQTLRIQYRANINIVSQAQVKISDPKMNKSEQQQFIKQILSSKARMQKRNIGYLNPIKKGSWYICNDDFDSIGYGYIVIQTRKASDYRIELIVDPKILKQIGYRLKSKKQQNKYTVCLQEGEGYTLILKIDEDFDINKQRVWPPQGIEIIRLWRKV